MQMERETLAFSLVTVLRGLVSTLIVCFAFRSFRVGRDNFNRGEISLSRRFTFRLTKSNTFLSLAVRVFTPC